MIDVTNWPEVPKALRPKPLFVNTILDADQLEGLKSLGWAIQDVRLLPNTSLQERQALVLAWFEGLRNGTIEPNSRLLDVLEAESKACGLTNLKQAPETKKDLSEETVDAILGGIENKRIRRK